MTYSDEILLVGDLHLRDTPPRNAVPSYPEDLLALVEWTFAYAIENKIRTVVWAGDVFDHKQPARTSHALVQQVMSVISMYTGMSNRGDEENELIIVGGNHDVTNDRLESIMSSQPLGVICRMPNVTLLEGWHPSKPIYGIPWQQRWHHEGVLESVFQPYRDAVPRGLSPEETLVVTHAPIFPDHLVPTNWEAFGASEVAAAMQRPGSLFWGHIHDDHGAFSVGDIRFCNPGALSRGSATETNMSRSIQCAVWSPPEPARMQVPVHPGGFRLVPIPAKSAAETFEVAKVVEAKQTAATLERFLSGLGSATIDVADRHGIIEHLRTLDITPPVKDRAIELLEEAP